MEDKDLLLKDLCSRIPYGVKVLVRSWDEIGMEYINKVDTLHSISCDNYINTTNEDCNFYVEDIKPYLFPLLSMTEEQYESLKELGILSNCNHSYEYVNPHIHGFSFIFKEFETYSLELIEWLNKNHFDYRCLIEKGLAINAIGLNIY